MRDGVEISAFGILVGAACGGVAGWWLARRAGRRHGEARAEAGSMAGVWPPVERDLIPDPALDWLRRAHGALGIWIAELDPEEEGPRAERLVDAERLSIGQITAVDRRLEVARDRDEGGVERVDGGLLVFRSTHGIAVGLLLPAATGDETARVAQVESDVRRLLDGLRRKPQALATVQARTREATFESAASVGLRLAYQIERMLGAHELRADVLVAVEEVAGARIVGVSGRADRRLLDGVLPEDSALARVARGEGEATAFAGDPLGGIMVDRRERLGAGWLLPMQTGRRVVGAVLIWLAPGEALADAVRIEVNEALADAAPRLVRAVEAGLAQQYGSSDALTGLPDRRGLIEVMEQRDGRPGTLIVLDLDHLAALNEALGSEAGDAVLVHIAHILRGQVRGDDLPARIEGGRFAVWLPDAEMELGTRVAERLRAKIHTTPWEWRGRHWTLAVSLGVAMRGGGGGASSTEALVAQATTALSHAKRRGRNRVETVG